MNRLILTVACVVVAPLFAGTARSEEGQTYLLRYSLQNGQRLNYEVTHVAKTKTRIRGDEEISQVHTVSKRHWDVAAASDDSMTFDHVVDAVEMTQQQGEKDEIRWSSESGDEAPREFSKVAERIGRKLSTVSINARGQETDRENNGGTNASLGMGSLTLALPEEPIAIGASWAVPREIKTRTEDGLVKPIKIRELYTLEKVKAGVATISIQSEPLTPIDAASVRAQVVQQLSNGEIKFDLDAGHMISKELQWDETVVGFQGPNSLMEYRARMNEELIDNIVRTARRQ
ncbi:hypothetical protein NHH03_10250 [Stieleria sp. TO1_6]|uniref:hypothetical protein n=1 Tax=Stieleria tagensis TaxID=2956795 RepID=UPI00209ABB33|nr:hypothetical protein [Stieleria tagensis]MCO8122119.1 hypothetical protein [Stieleria tagensis]